MSKITFDDKRLEEVAVQAIKEKMSSSLNYGEMNAIMNEAFDSHRDEIAQLVSDSLSNIFKSPKTKQIIQEEFEHKVAKTLVAKLEGSVEKAVEAYRNDPTLRAKIIIAIENMVNENQTEHL